MNKNGDLEASFFQGYTDRLDAALKVAKWDGVLELSKELLDCWKTGRQIFICGNGGSAGNAIHLANDFIYGISRKSGSGLKIEALSANPAVLTCLANDEGYEKIYSMQLYVKAKSNDVLIALSGSGNSPNIVEALKASKDIGMMSFAILGFDGGISKKISDVPLHFPVDDMQISEDLQLIIGHMVMQWLYAHKDEIS
jgi:D-sedoheptulose 7-phosphate isomerase